VVFGHVVIVLIVEVDGCDFDTCFLDRGGAAPEAVVPWLVDRLETDVLESAMGQ